MILQGFLRSHQYRGIQEYDVLHDILRLYRMPLDMGLHICYSNKLFLKDNRYLSHIQGDILGMDLHSNQLSKYKLQHYSSLYIVRLARKVMGYTDLFHLHLVLLLYLLNNIKLLINMTNTSHQNYR